MIPFLPSVTGTASSKRASSERASSSGEATSATS